MYYDFMSHISKLLIDWTGAIIVRKRQLHNVIVHTSKRYPMAEHITAVLFSIVSYSIPGVRYFEDSRADFQLRDPISAHIYTEDQLLESDIVIESEERQSSSSNSRSNLNTCYTRRRGRSAIDLLDANHRMSLMLNPIHINETSIICPRDVSNDYLLDVFKPTRVTRMRRDIEQQNRIENIRPSSSPTRGSAG